MGRIVKRQVKNWFLILIVAIMLIIGGIELNPGPLEKEDIKEMFEANYIRIQESITNQFKLHEEKFEKKLDSMTENWNGIKEEINKVKVEMKELKKIDIIEQNFRNHNVVIYGIDRNNTESKYDTIYRVLELFANEMNVRVHEDSIDNCFWLGNRRRRPLLVRFTRVITREEILDKAKMLKGLKIWIERDFDFCTRKVRRELLPYMWEVRKNGQRAVLKFGKLKIGDQLYDLDFCKKNLEKEEANGNFLRSESQNLQEVELENNRANRTLRSRSQSPSRNRRG